MDFSDTAEEAAFRAEVQAFLHANAAPKTGARETWRTRHPVASEALKLAKDWQARKADAGFAAITWPKDVGGRGGTQIQQVIYQQEESRYITPRGYFDIGLGMCIPTLMTYGRDDHIKRYVPKALRGEEIWCQLFSEPSAGSDVAGLRTKCVRDGDDWIINGQKIWTSGAHFSDYGIIVCRHDANVPKHKGLTFFFLDMKSPGVEVRPIKQINGDRNFNEVYFTDVRVPDSQRLGAVGDGWKVSLTTLMNERLAVGDSPGPDFPEIFAFAQQAMLEDGPALDNAAVRDRLADIYTREMGLKYTRFRIITALSQGQTAGPENSISKLVMANQLQDIAHFGMDLQDMGGMMTGENGGMGGMFQEALMFAPGRRIAGGTDEVLRNIIAERVLGMPGDVRVDKDIAFKDLPTGNS